MQYRLYKKTTNPFQDTNTAAFIENITYVIFWVFLLILSLYILIFHMPHFQCQVKCSVAKVFAMDAVICNLIHVLWFQYLDKQIQTLKCNKGQQLITINELKHTSNWCSC